MTPLERISQEIEYLEPISPTLPRLAQLIDDPDSGLNEIVAVIEYDPMMTANCLKLANSAYYATGYEVDTVRGAVQKLGTGRILEYSVGREIGGRLKKACPEYGLRECELWEHSVAAATAASLLPQFAKKPVHQAAFTASLLHDLGKIVMSRYLDEELLNDIQNWIKSRKGTYVEAETAVLGCNHAQIGGLIARRWKFPAILAESIAYHHDPRGKGPSSIVLDAVHVCNTVAKTIGIGIGTEEMNMAASAEAAGSLGLSPGSIEALCAATKIELPRVLSIFEEDKHVV